MKRPYKHCYVLHTPYNKDHAGTVEVMKVIDSFMHDGTVASAEKEMNRHQTEYARKHGFGHLQLVVSSGKRFWL